MLSEPEKQNRMAIPKKLEEIRFDEVTFSYAPNEIVLDRVSFSLSAGETLAIVGPTGAGKTSIVNLITRFYDPDSGNLSINGVDIKIKVPIRAFTDGFRKYFLNFLGYKTYLLCIRRKMTGISWFIGKQYRLKCIDFI